MQSFRRTSSTTNPYLTQLTEFLPGYVETVSFSWSRAIFGNYDVFHTHWPENLLRGRGGLRTVARTALFTLLLTRLQVSKIALVRTLHNVTAHERGGVLERPLLLWCDRRTDLWIRLNDTTSPPTERRVVTIQHGHYREWFSRYPDHSPVRGRILAFGIIRPYKGIERLLSEFKMLDDPLASLRIVGRPVSETIASRVVSEATDDPRIGLDLRYTPDEELAREVNESELVVLPYTTMHNSGALILAMSLNRPALVPISEVTLALQAEFGGEWIRTFSGDIGVDDLVEAMTWAASPRQSPAPDLSSREWALIGSQHAEAYEAASRYRRSRNSGV